MPFFPASTTYQRAHTVFCLVTHSATSDAISVVDRDGRIIWLFGIVFLFMLNPNVSPSARFFRVSRLSRFSLSSILVFPLIFLSTLTQIFPQIKFMLSILILVPSCSSRPPLSAPPTESTLVEATPKLESWVRATKTLHIVPKVLMSKYPLSRGSLPTSKTSTSHRISTRPSNLSKRPRIPSKSGPNPRITPTNRLKKLGGNQF